MGKKRVGGRGTGHVELQNKSQLCGLSPLYALPQVDSKIIMGPGRLAQALSQQHHMQVRTGWEGQVEALSAAAIARFYLPALLGQEHGCMPNRVHHLCTCQLMLLIVTLPAGGGDFGASSSACARPAPTRSGTGILQVGRTLGLSLNRVPLTVPASLKWTCAGEQSLQIHLSMARLPLLLLF